ncbi:MAG: discoidin domain-containing protein, partial [Bacteroidota bacterium]
LQNGKERVLIVGRASSLGNAIGKGQEVKVVSDGFVKAANKRGAKLEQQMNALIKEADVIVVDGKNVGGTLADNKYVKGGLGYGVPIVFENVSQSEMTNLIGLGMPTGEITIVTNYIDRNGASVEILSKPQEMGEIEGFSDEASRKPSNAEIDKAKQEGKNPDELERQLTTKWQNEIKRIEKGQISTQSIERVSNEARAKSIMGIVRDKNKNIRKRTSFDNRSGALENVIDRHGMEEFGQLAKGGPSTDVNLIPVQSHTQLPIFSSSNPYDFSKFVFDVTYNWTWRCDNVQTMQQRLDLEVELVAAIQPYRKYVRVKVKDGSYFKPGSMHWNSEYNKGYMNSECRVRFDYLNADGNEFKLDRYAPSNSNPTTTYTSTTGFSLSANVGADASNGPSSGLSASYSESNSVSSTVREFEASASTGSTWTEFKFKMGKHPSDYVEQCFGCTPSIINLPALATDQLTPKSEVVFTAPGDYTGSKSIQLKTTHYGMRIYSNGDWFYPHWYWRSKGWWISSNFSVNFSKVSYPHLAIDDTATASSTYSNWDPSRAVDGYTEGSLSFAGTRWGSEPYIQVDLKERQFIYDIDIWNATAYGSGYLKDYWVMISNTPFTSASLSDAKNQSIWKEKVTGSSPRIKKFDTRISGRYVRVQREGSNFLILGEIACNPRRN